MQQLPSFEYLLSVHYLKKLRTLGIITYEEQDEIDRLNKTTFSKGQGRKTA